MGKEKLVWTLLRLSLGWIFFWAFIDKVFGLGFGTSPEKSWLNGGSPTTGFLANVPEGPFQAFFQSLSGNPVVDWLFMLGLAGVGIALLLGIGVRIAGYAGAAIVLLIFAASAMPPSHNPLIDDHIVYALVLVGLTFVNSGRGLGLGGWWENTPIVKKLPLLK